MDEHRSLQCEQIVLSAEDESVRYIDFYGRASKSLKGGIKQRKLDHKNIRHYVNNTSTGRDLYHIYRIYLEAIGNKGDFYRRPLDGQNIAFSQQPVGVHKLGTIIKNACSKAGLDGNFTNHSGKRTCATVLFQNGVDEG
jgi:hypothetical protein